MKKTAIATIIHAIIAVIALVFVNCNDSWLNDNKGGPADEFLQSFFTYTLTVVEISADSGTVWPEGTEVYRAGERVTVTAEPAIGYVFAGWIGAPSEVNASDASITVIIDKNLTLAARFQPSKHILTTTITPSTNAGGVVYSPLNTDYVYGTLVTATAAANPGYVFMGWNGKITSSDTITLTMDSDLTLTANFMPLDGVAGVWNCGDSVKAILKGDTLAITGTGDMWNDSYFHGRWHDYADQITAVIIEYGITGIGDWAFADCANLTSATIPSSVKKIGHGAFYGCMGLTHIGIPNGVVSIGHSAFYGCAGLTIMAIPSSVTNIDYMAFSGCTNLANVFVLSAVPPALTESHELTGADELETFGDETKANACLHVPAVGMEAYESAYEWRDFMCIVAAD